MDENVITREQLIECIVKACRTMQVHVPCQDYYARRGDSQTETIEFIDAQALIDAINGM